MNNNPNTPVTVAILGLGQRGTYVYGKYADQFPEQMRIVAVAEPNAERVGRFQKDSSASFRSFSSWQDLAAEPRMADAVIIATQDQDHIHAVQAFAALGYHLLIEKPMAHTAEDCRKLVAIAEAHDQSIMAVSHVLRYTSYFQKLKLLLDQGIIGEIATVQHLEPVGFDHQAHSFVRGNWRRADETSPMIVAKCCHDMDILLYLLDKKCVRLSSVGHLKHFRPEAKPEGATDRCLTCPVERNCPYSAIRIYEEPSKRGEYDFPVHVITEDKSLEAVQEALREGPYGRCVYACDNDVVDHQVVAFEFEDRISATLTMTAFTAGGFRDTYIMGTRGTLRGNGDRIEHFDFLTKQTSVVEIDHDPSGHYGGDNGLIRDFLIAVARNDPSYHHSSPSESLESHLMAFAAEEARVSNRVVGLQLE